jgi:hypothetical protein
MLHSTPTMRHAGGRQRVKKPAQDRFWSSRYVVQGFQQRLLFEMIANAEGVRVFMQTIRKMLYEGNFLSRRPCIRISLKRRHGQAGYEWTMEHLHGSCNIRYTFCSLMSPGSV